MRGIYLIVGAVLAIAATATLIVTDNPRLLKTAVIVAVWACVFALLAGSRPRRDGELSSSREEELRRTYELEIDREVAARREYELRLEVALRRELENHLKKDLGELRAQVGALRKEMAERWNGELRLERFALRAESTRLTGADRQVLEEQAGRLGLESNGGRTDIAYNLEQGTNTLPAKARSAEPPQLPNGRPIEAPANGRTYESPATGRTYESSANGRTYESPANGRTYEPAANGRTFDELANRRTYESPVNAESPAEAPAAEVSTPNPEPELPQQPASQRHDPLFGPLPAGLPEPEWAPVNGAYNGDDPSGPAVTLSGRRHRRRADDTGISPAVRSEPTDDAADEPPARPAYPETPFRPRMVAEPAGRHGRGEEDGQPKRRRRYRDEDEENDVLARIRQQR